jgi:hypothetical protein
MNRLRVPLCTLRFHSPYYRVFQQDSPGEFDITGGDSLLHEGDERILATMVSRLQPER